MATPAQVLQELRFAERLAEVEARVAPALAKAQNEPSLARRNQARRVLYRDAELLRVEIEERLNALGIEAQWLAAPEMREANAQLDAVRKQLRLEVLPASKSPFETAYMGVRLATLVLLLVGWFSAITLLIPLKLLNPALKQLGVKKNYFPMDVISVRYLLACWLRHAYLSLTLVFDAAVGDGQPALHRVVRGLHGRGNGQHPGSGRRHRLHVQVRSSHASDIDRAGHFD